HTKIIFICSPNNPTGNLLDREKIRRIIEAFSGIIVLDEAYGDFAAEASFLPELARYPNLVILQTLSKAWGLAGLRVGMAFAQERIIEVLTAMKPPYNMSTANQRMALAAVRSGGAERESTCAEICALRDL